MGDYLKSLSASQLKKLIGNRIDQYLDAEFDYTIKNLTTPNVNTEGKKIYFEVEIREKELQQ